MGDGGTVVQRFKDGRFEFLKMLIKCGKRNCGKCPHGPYWYVRYWIGRRCKKIYVGKELGAWMEKKGITLLARIGNVKEREDMLDLHCGPGVDVENAMKEVGCGGESGVPVGGASGATGAFADGLSL
jgi:hypothetical protein